MAKSHFATIDYDTPNQFSSINCSDLLYTTVFHFVTFQNFGLPPYPLGKRSPTDTLACNIIHKNVAWLGRKATRRWLSVH